MRSCVCVARLLIVGGLAFTPSIAHPPSVNRRRRSWPAAVTAFLARLKTYEVYSTAVQSVDTINLSYQLQRKHSISPGFHAERDRVRGPPAHFRRAGVHAVHHLPSAGRVARGGHGERDSACTDILSKNRYRKHVNCGC